KSLNLTVFVQVLDTPDPPKVETLIDTANIQENEGVTFAQDVYYSFSDQDSDAFDLIWNWYLDDEPVPPEQISDRYNFEYIPAMTAEKDRTVIVRLEVIDGVFINGTSWTVFITNLNAPPADLEVTTAANKTEYKHGETISFSATATDLDGDTLTYTWFLDLLDEVGTGPTLDLKDVDSGPHKVTVSVKDQSGTETTEDFNFNVAKKDGGEDESPGFNLAYIALALIGAVAIMAILRRR
ncbi:MAG: PKD domain-containing protein, partial [Thermoplasmata archaeon]|nr:PKD domain-containing protein [Thermoplasmata archaeon]